MTDDFFRAVGVELLSDEAIAADHMLRAVRDRVTYLIKDTIGCTMQVTLAVAGRRRVRRGQAGTGLGHAAARLGAEQSVMSGWGPTRTRRAGGSGAIPATCGQ